MSRIVYIGTAEAEAGAFAERARRDFPDLELIAVDDREAARAHCVSAEAIIGHHFQFDEAMLEAAPRLRWIQSLTTGTDAILKLAHLRQDVTVTSTRGMHGPQMSELVFLQMLALLRDFPRMVRNQAAARWERWPQPLLWGKTIVIVGVGAIAEALAPRCAAFGMRVIGVSGTPRTVAGFERVVARSDLAAVAAQADFLVLIVPHSADTECLVDARVIGAMPTQSYLINVARGGVLDEMALQQALEAGRIAGAALDVFRQTPLPPAHPLWHAPRTLLTPHIGGMSDIYLEQAYPTVRFNLARFLAGDLTNMRNVVPHA